MSNRTARRLGGPLTSSQSNIRLGSHTVIVHHLTWFPTTSLLTILHSPHIVIIRHPTWSSYRHSPPSDLVPHNVRVHIRLGTHTVIVHHPTWPHIVKSTAQPKHLFLNCFCSVRCILFPAAPVLAWCISVK